MGKKTNKTNKTPQVIRRWKWGRISICGAFPYPELKLFWFWVIATNQRNNKGDFYIYFFSDTSETLRRNSHINVLEKEWERGSAKVAHIAEIAASSASKEKLRILIKERALEKIP